MTTCECAGPYALLTVGVDSDSDMALIQCESAGHRAVVAAARVVDSDTGVDLRALLGGALNQPAARGRAPAAAPQLGSPAEAPLQTPPAPPAVTPVSPELVPSPADSQAAAPALEQAIKDTSVLEALPRSDAPPPPSVGQALSSAPPPADSAKALIDSAAGTPPGDAGFGGALLEAPPVEVPPIAPPPPPPAPALVPPPALDTEGGAQDALGGAQDAASSAAATATDGALCVACLHSCSCRCADDACQRLELPSLLCPPRPVRPRAPCICGHRAATSRV